MPRKGWGFWLKCRECKQPYRFDTKWERDGAGGLCPGCRCDEVIIYSKKRADESKALSRRQEKEE